MNRPLLIIAFLLVFNGGTTLIYGENDKSIVLTNKDEEVNDKSKKYKYTKKQFVQKLDTLKTEKELLEVLGSPIDTETIGKQKKLLFDVRIVFENGSIRYPRITVVDGKKRVVMYRPEKNLYKKTSDIKIAKLKHYAI